MVGFGCPPRLEAALIDKSTRTIAALDDADTRALSIAIAGPAALLVSKLHKIEERLAEGRPRRLDDKDGLDVLRLLQAVPTEPLARAFRMLLQDSMAREVTQETLTSLKARFSEERSAGPQMAARAAAPLADANVIAKSCALLATDLLEAVRASGRNER
jgi:hypothetical protein